MKKYLSRIFTFAALFLSALAPLSAETKADAQSFADSGKLRGDTAAVVAKGDEKPASAIARLKAHESPSGLRIDRDADFAFAAIDVGQRLIAAGKHAEAEEFFREAEKALIKMVKKTPDTATTEKAQYLSKLALIRANYLNNATQAKADLEDAKKLRPDDKYLDGLRDSLGSEHGDVFKEKSKS